MFMTPTNEAKRWPAIMLDLETGAVEDDAAILEIGAVAFDPETGETGECLWLLIDWESNDAAGRRWSGSTMAWWARRWRAGLCPVPDPNGLVGLAEAVRTAHEFISRLLGDGGEMWSKGNFDMPKMRHAMRHHGLTVPWQHWQEREMRTVMRWEGVANSGDGVAHQAIRDAVEQARCVCRMRAERRRA